MKRGLILGTIGVLILGGSGLYLRSRYFGGKAVTKEKIALALSESTGVDRFPAELELPVRDEFGREQVQQLKPRYSLDPNLQEAMEGLMKTYSPDYGAFVAMDPTTGQILSLVSFTRDPQYKSHLALQATFPSASVFKVVTAAAAIEGKRYSANTVISFNGRNHTLYRSAIFKTSHNRWTRFVTLKDAFAKSINSVFGKIGAYGVGSEGLRTYADRFQFNRKIAADIPVQQGNAWIPTDIWGLAEAASGYTQENTMSPLQGAMIAAAVANDGMMMEPYLVQALYSVKGDRIYYAEPRAASHSVDPKTASELRALMRETVVRGTSQKSFRGFFKGDFAAMNVGGKTGSLSGKDPRGKYDWFVGYANYGSRKIAVSALTIHQKLWRVKSSYLARKAFESYFRDLDAHPRRRNVASRRGVVSVGTQ